MSSRLDGLLDRTLKLAQDLFADVVEGALARTKRALVRNAMSLVVGAGAMVLALVFAAIGFNRWLETIVDANHRWAPPAVVAVVCAVIGFAALHAVRGRGDR